MAEGKEFEMVAANCFEINAPEYRRTSIAGNVYLFCFSSLMFIIVSISSASAIEIKGEVVDVEDGRAQIEYKGEYAPRIGDKVELGFEYPGEGFLSKGEWKITRITHDFAWAKPDEAVSEEAAPGDIAIIHSLKPQKRNKLARKDVAPKEMRRTEKSAFEDFVQIDITSRHGDTGGTAKCDGETSWDGSTLHIITGQLQYCHMTISTEPVQNFRITTKLDVRGNNSAMFSAGIIFGAFDGNRSRKGNFFFTRDGMLGSLFFQVWQIRGEKESTRVIYQGVPMGAVLKGMNTFEMIRIGNSFRFRINGNNIASWTDSGSMRGEVRLFAAQMSDATFQDFKVYKLVIGK